MYRRRRRPPQEIGFSFDSFLDVVANVVGIIIRLILVVWVGARAYTAMQPLPTPPAATATAEAAGPHEPLQDEVARQRQELADVQARLLQQVRSFQQYQDLQTQARRELTAVTAQRQEREGAKANSARSPEEHVGSVALTLEEVRQRCQRLTEQIQQLEKLPPVKQTLRYQTPVSRPVKSEELFFECRGGRVTFIDIAAFMTEVRRGLEEKTKQLRSQWEVSDVAGPVGAFQLHYTVERERGLLDGGGLGPDAQGSFRAGLSGWQLEPLSGLRGETEEQAFKPGSDFRQIADVLDPQQHTVTFWVYPDSFALYRRLRDYLYEKDIVVAGRPLPDGSPISASRNGSASRGQ
jgi:hypothetical protein